MTLFVLIVVGILAVIILTAVGAYLNIKDDSDGNATHTDTGDDCKVDKREEKRRANLRQVLEALERSESGKVTNNDVEALIGVSDATASRYLSELEAEGKIRQVGDTGKSVYYVLQSKEQ